MRRTITYQGITYPSAAAAGRAFGLTPKMIIQRLQAGYSVKDALTTPKNFLTSHLAKDHLGKIYSSLSAMCRAYGLKANTVRCRLDAGLSIKDALTLPPNRNIRSTNNKHCFRQITVNGKKYNSVAAACKSCGSCLASSTVITRLNRGWAPEKALFTPAINKIKSRDHLGNEFCSMVEMCRFWKIAYSTFFHRLDMGWSIEKALTTPVKKYAYH
jgi:hypothetical protein